VFKGVVGFYGIEKPIFCETAKFQKLFNRLPNDWAKSLLSPAQFADRSNLTSDCG